MPHVAQTTSLSTTHPACQSREEIFGFMTHAEETNRGNAITRRRLLVGGAAVAGVAGAAGAGVTIFALNEGKHSTGGSQPTIKSITNGHTITYQVVQEDGTGSINHTDTRWGLYGADLGHTFLHRGQMYMVFGDSFGGPAANPFSPQHHSDWRSNTMARINISASTNPLQGLVFDEMITDRPGHAKELLPSRKVSGDEVTVIPTYGVSVAPRMFLHYMSVNTWGRPGHWTLNYSGLAYSDDDGQNWTKDENMTWPAESNFGQVAIVENEDYLYFFGIPGGRYGGLQLARVRPQAILDKTAYHYWDGSAWQANHPGAAATIVPAPVGELSVRWNSYYKKWLMMYLNDPRYRIVLRTADQLTGPWSAEQVIVTGEQYSQLYAPYITPLWNDGPDIFYTMSLFIPYHVDLMRTRLERA